MKRFYSYLISEVLGLYIVGVATIVILLMLLSFLTVLPDVLSRGVPPALVAQFILYTAPALFGKAIPLALLFSSLLALTRLAQDSEIKAALLLGLSPKHFIMPLLLLSLVITSISFINNEIIVPWSQKKALQVQKSILLASPASFVEEGSFFTDAQGRSIYIEKLSKDGQFKNVTVIKPGGSQGPREIIFAKSAKVDKKSGVWNLEDIRFRTFRNSSLVLDAKAKTAILPVRSLAAGSSTLPALIYLPMRELIARLKNPNARNHAEWTALHRKFAEPLIAIVFSLFALAITLVSFRSNFGLGLVSVLFLTFIYYATWSVANVLGNQGTLPAYIAAWIPFALYAFSAAALFIFAWRR